ncbi:MAG TPA: TatD family hydrolase [Bacteroidales bacterium]|nr:TatD family hydrolase [Bacteroidales bacterium]HQI69394.1 TatD family hydrolase [Bacteroidales bacterium]
MFFVDTHTHLYAEEFSEDIDDVIRRAIEQGVTKLLLPDIDSSSRNSMMELHFRYPEVCLPMIGLHPTSVKEDFKSGLQEIETAITSGKFYGIGETGIDLYWDKTFIHEQIEAFTFQVELALRYNLPVVIHSRKSLHEIFPIIKKYCHRGLTGVFHCFPGNINEARQVIDMGFYLGIGGVVTYKNSSMAAVVQHFGLDNLVLETDAPYLPPVPYRGKRNESSHIPEIASFIAQILNTTSNEVAHVTSANAARLFHI